MLKYYQKEVLYMNDTIACISTALGIGAISIIRVSGNDSINIVSKIWKGKELSKVDTHTIHYGHIIDNDIILVLFIPLRKGKFHKTTCYCTKLLLFRLYYTIIYQYFVYKLQLTHFYLFFTSTY